MYVERRWRVKATLNRNGIIERGGASLVMHKIL
jgi:hypothetical protein